MARADGTLFLFPFFAGLKPGATKRLVRYADCQKILKNKADNLSIIRF